MNVSRIADKSRPDYWPRKVADLERAVKAEQARAAQLWAALSALTDRVAALETPTT